MPAPIRDHPAIPVRKRNRYEFPSTVTALLIIANSLVYGTMVFFAGSEMISKAETETLINFGANFPPKTRLEFQFWRTFTSLFVHIDFAHFAGNMVILLVAGTRVEPALGHLQFALIYIVSGIMGSVIGIWWTPLAVQAGASGAIFGIFGAALALAETRNVSARPEDMRFLAIFAAYGLFAGMLKSGISNAAHLTGIVCGWFLCVLFTKFQQTRAGWFARLAALLVMLVIAQGVYMNTGARVTKLYDDHNMHSKAVRDYISRMGPVAQRVYPIAKRLYANGEWPASAAQQLSADTTAMNQLRADARETESIRCEYDEIREFHTPLAKLTAAALKYLETSTDNTTEKVNVMVGFFEFQSVSGKLEKMVRRSK